MLRLKELRKARGLTQEELIEQFNERYGKRYAASSLSMFENGKRIPETQSHMDFADFFGVSSDYILGLTATPAAPAPAQPPAQKVTHYTYRIPVVGRVAAGQPILAQEEIIDYEYIDERLHKGGD